MFHFPGAPQPDVLLCHPAFEALQEGNKDYWAPFPRPSCPAVVDERCQVTGAMAGVLLAQGHAAEGSGKEHL